jgi:uncharacterized iron-regulated membrane protein
MFLLEYLTVILLAFAPAALSFFLDYTLGFPGHEEGKFGTKAIFFSYTLAMAKRRLPAKKEDELVKGFSGMLNSDDPGTRLEGKKLLNTSIVLEGQKYFKWELAFGMCQYCTGFWIALISAFFMYWLVPLEWVFPPLLFLLIPIFAHTILRKLLN